MAFNLPVQNYFRRTDGPSAYSRPSDWPVITDAAAEVQFLFCDLNDAECSISTTFTRTSGSQNIVIDWGDTTTSAVTATTATYTNKTYTPGSGTACSLGYTTFKIRVYFTGTGVSFLNNCNILPKLISGDVRLSQSLPVLEAYYGNSTQTATTVNFYSLGSNTSTNAVYGYLQFVKLPATVSWTSWSNIFSYCTALLKIVMPTSNSQMNNVNQAFRNCYSLLEVTFPSNATGITDFSLVFDSCSNLRSVTLPTTLNSCTTFSFAFNSCFNLRSLTFPSINTCSVLQFAFQSCFQLEWVKFTSMPTVVGTINMQSVFYSCSNLQNVYFPATGSTGSTYTFINTFQLCTQLKSIVLPSNINVSNFQQAFNQCTSLISCILPINSLAGTDYSNMFSSCSSLINIKLPNAPSAAVSLNSIFQYCFKLQQVTIPSGYTFTNLANAFFNCYSLKTLTWTPGVQNSLTTLSFTFINAYQLTSISMPSSMTELTTLANTFTNCYMLKEVTLPSSLNKVTTMASIFNGSNLLTSVTLPTSMSACTNFSNVFGNCRSISGVTLPNIVSLSTTTFQSAFNNCFNLKTCVLPGAAQLSGVTDITTMFQLCSNLTTLTNFDKIGSLTTTPILAASNFIYNRFKSGSAISFSGPLSKLELQGLASNQRTDVQGVRLLNTSAGQWGGTSPQINISNTNMSTAQIVQLFTDMAAQGAVFSKTINITTATGTAGLTLANRQIITNNGWTITG